MTISPATLPPCTVGVNYSVTLTAIGGRGSKNWVIIAGNLPPGLTLIRVNSSTATISGVATRDGQYNFNIRVTSSQGDVATVAYD